jgi:hypothetical protein
MAESKPVRIPVEIHSNLKDFRLRIQADARRDITMGEIIGLLTELGESHYSEMVQLAKIRG